jgi:hypothetical protein
MQQMNTQEQKKNTTMNYLKQFVIAICAVYEK